MKRKRCDRAPNCGCHAKHYPSISAIERHEREVTRRMAWCIKNNLTPANTHIHKAPGNDEEFVYGIPPWNADGSINPMGVYSAPPTEKEKEFIQLEKDANTEWVCTACKKTVNARPKKWTSKNGEPEPWNWWFCFECKSTQNKPSKKELSQQNEISKIHDIRRWTLK